MEYAYDCGGYRECCNELDAFRNAYIGKKRWGNEYNLDLRPWLEREKYQEFICSGFMEPYVRNHGLQQNDMGYSEFCEKFPAPIYGGKGYASKRYAFLDSDDIWMPEKLEKQIKWMEENGYDFVNAGSIHIEPLAIFSQRYESLEDVEDGATVLVSNNQSDWGRIIGIFQEAGLVTVKEGVDLTTATFEDIDENPKNLTFEYENDPALMTTLYQQDEAELIAINSNFAVDQDISPLDDSIAIESSSSPYANIIAVRSEDAEDPAILKLVETLKSKDVQDFILEEWDGAVVPVTE